MMGFVGGCAAPASTRGRRAVNSRRNTVRMQDRHFIEDIEIQGYPGTVRNNVLVKVAEAEEVTSVGLIIATEAREKPNYGIVENVGTGYRYPTTGVQVPMEVQPGDCVIYGTYGFDEVTIDDEDYAFVSQDGVLAKVDGEYSAENVRPIFDTIFVRRDKRGADLGSGLVLSDSAVKDKPNTGEILAVGPGRLMENGEYEKSPYKVGDRVCFFKGAGTSVKFEAVDHVLLRVVEVLAKC